MTEEEKKAVEEKERADKQAAADAEPSEFEKQLKEKDDRITKLTEEKENYRRGMLAAKGKTPDGKEPELTLDEKIAAGVQEGILNSEIYKNQTEKDAIIKKALERNKELETTIKNRSQINTTEQGGGNEQTMKPKDTTISADKIKELKARGFDDKMIERYKLNLLKGTQ